MTRPPGLALYRAATALAGPFAPIALERRAGRGKEDPARIGERRGIASAARPEGALVWLHAASVGESLVALAAAKELAARRPGATFLFTSGTRTSAGLIAARAPENTIHQYVPVDRPAYVRRFMAHWRPDLAVFVESELWPNLILEARRSGAKLALINARMNTASLKRWDGWRASARRLLTCFDWIGAADARTAEGLGGIAGWEIPHAGNLKLEAEAPAPDAAALEAARRAVAGRPVFVAASTHPGEEAVLARAHRALLRDHPRALMILAPRHPERRHQVAEALAREGLAYAMRSSGGEPDADVPVWLADTLGEMELWFTLAPAAFIGGSLIENIGGHNPVEATRAGAAVVTGPYTASFEDVYTAYRATGAVALAGGAEAIAAAIEQIWAGGDPTPEAGTAVLERLSGGAMETTLAALQTLLPEEKRS